MTRCIMRRTKNCSTNQTLIWRRSRISRWAWRMVWRHQDRPSGTALTSSATLTQTTTNMTTPWPHSRLSTPSLALSNESSMIWRRRLRTRIVSWRNWRATFIRRSARRHWNLKGSDQNRKLKLSVILTSMRCKGWTSSTHEWLRSKKKR